MPLQVCNKMCTILQKNRTITILAANDYAANIYRLCSAHLFGVHYSGAQEAIATHCEHCTTVITQNTQNGAQCVMLCCRQLFWRQICLLLFFLQSTTSISNSTCPLSPQVHQQ